MSMRLKISIVLTFLMAIAVIAMAIYNRLVPEEDSQQMGRLSLDGRRLWTLCNDFPPLVDSDAL